jgi:hypothetical protein
MQQEQRCHTCSRLFFPDPPNARVCRACWRYWDRLEKHFARQAELAARNKARRAAARVDVRGS